MDNNFSYVFSLCFGIFTRNETNPLDTPSWIWKYVKYFDGTVVIRIINRNPNITSLGACYFEIRQSLEIQDFNWHITSSLDGDYLTQSPTGYDPVNIFALQKGFLFFRYSSASNPDDINTYEEWDVLLIGMEIKFFT
ncbi:hypothetical protein Glove_109g164 [Diversispora epigaea]|uniref:Uncharacterized protein n=1 Tax=Diversispora epigaea TaxID=1348612 RepID=A0A397JCT6_9GLOM|nr:hypothetical protein Glove_109g164 [Diversispora epigaea]